MSDTVSLSIISSGTPSYVSAPQPARWASGSTLLSAGSLVWNSVLGTTPMPPQETVFLTRTQQRIMRRALRRSFRIIA